MRALTPDSAWPRARLGEALSRVDVALRGAEDSRALANPAPDLHAGPSLARWLSAGARRLGLDVDAPDHAARGLPELLPEHTVLLARWPTQEGEDPNASPYVVVLGPVHTADVTARVVAPAGVHDVSVAALEEALFQGDTRALVAELGLRPADTLAAARAIRGTVGGGLRAEGFLLEPAALQFWERAQRVGVPRLLVGGFVGFALQVALFGGAWALVGEGALEGRLEPGNLMAFGLLLATMVMVRARASAALGRAVILLSGLARERLLEGILRLDAGLIRTRGVGQLLGTVLEVDSLELLARAGGPAVIWVVLDLALGATLCALGAGGALSLALLGVWMAFLLLGLRRLLKRLLVFTDTRLNVTHELVEAMVGHRTLVAQDAQARHADHLRAGLETYQDRAARLDETTARLVSVVPRGFLVLGLVALVPAFMDRGTEAGGLALAVGGLLVVWGALRRLSETSPAVMAAYVAWRHLAFLFEAATRAQGSSADVLAAAPDEAAVGRRGLLVGRDLVFRYPGRPEPVLKGCSFSVRRDERVLLEGGSGGGKSTLGSILAGLRVPDAGVLLLGGFDHHAVGPERWRQRAGGVPQFHDNHVFAGSLLFNLLMGRRWPPRREDMEAAEAVCRELGLGPLLDRMPAGLAQTVGDSGWQLSHGERSRVFVARSLLQRVDVRVFDESLAALDPETSLRVLAALIKRPEALILIAHR